MREFECRMLELEGNFSCKQFQQDVETVRFPSMLKRGYGTFQP